MIQRPYSAPSTDHGFRRASCDKRKAGDAQNQACALPAGSQTTQRRRNISRKYADPDVSWKRNACRARGGADRPVMALFHGFPAARRMFRALIPRPESRFHLIVPGYPGFGQSESPSGETFACAFDHLAEVTDGFPKIKGVREFCLHVFDCGAPIGFKTAMKHPAEIPGIVSQNGLSIRRIWAENGKPGPNTGKTLRRSCGNSARAPLRPTP